MEPSEIQPMAKYLLTILLLEAVKCYNENNLMGLKWVQKTMFTFGSRMRELDERDRKP